jgi:TolB-like protein/tetratricopeptide (TPR) repeat protein
MSDVFISYKAEDRARVRPLVEALEAEGLSVWWDAHIGGGDEWRETIARHLDDARCVIVVWSKRSVGPEGHFVRDEATRALRRHAYLPVRIDKVDPPLGFGETQALPLHGWKGNRSDPRYIAVANGVRSIIGLEAHHEVSSATGLGRRPVMIGGAAAVAAVAAGGWWFLKPSAAKANSIAVLPFANLSGDPTQAYFSDGIAEELRSALSRIAGLKVVARTSSEMLRNADVKTAAKKLSVANVLTGSVRRSPSMIRVNAQLVDGDDGLERWSETFDRPAGDVLTVQTEIAENVAQALRIELAPVDRSSLAIGGTSSAEAQDLFLRSDQIRRDDSETSFRGALSLLDQAIALDPNYAQAHARKAFVLTFLASVHALSAEQARREGELAIQSARRAIAIAPRLAAGHAALAAILRDQLQMGPALQEVRRAYALGGTDALALHNYTQLLSQSGRSDEALAMVKRAIELDPLNPVSAEVETVTLFYSRRYQDALAAARRGLQMTPDRIRIRAFLGHSLLQLGQADAAAREYARMPGGDYRRHLGEAIIAARKGRGAEAEQALKAMEQRYGDAANYQYAEIYAQLGMVDRAFDALEVAWNLRDAGFGYLRVDPFVDPLRKDPRFALLERRLNFP